ncbi:hypothetical protein [Ferruginibacter albus]|uniref:hypothetical protein n=1 Tax=Ferruginibacter albus TaxID=2875540 RepID=UPI001CC6CE0C|nr:hypothetical protein [Ferruginibacter albus]UAY53374.1 hypothetical protein K9M53_06800 [Ferruginibacter albus]
MSFLKKLFGSKKKVVEPEKEKINVRGIYTNAHFDNRYEEENIDPKMVEGCLKMIESYFIDNKIIKKIEDPINHPINLDQLDQDGFGFILYCKAFRLEEAQAAMFLAYAFSAYLIENYSFKLFKDKNPEFPLRSMTLKYDKEGTMLSLYPFEYTSKVLNGNETFSNLEERVKSQITKMADINKVIHKFIKPGDKTD